MQAHNRQTLVRRLANNEDDLYLFADAPEMEDVVAQELLPNPLVVLARDDHPLAGEKNITFERLAREPFLLREEGSGTRRITMRLFAAARARPAGPDGARHERSDQGGDPRGPRRDRHVALHLRARSRVLAVCVPRRRGLPAREPLVLRVSRGQAAHRGGARVPGFRAHGGEGSGAGEPGNRAL